MTDRCRADGNGRAPTGRDRSPSESARDPTPATPGRSPRDTVIPTPTWVPTDDVIGSTPDRQILVVGDTPTGLALTCLLRAAGYDPVLAGAADTPTASRVTFLSPAAMEVLGSLDAGASLLDSGVAVDTVAVGSVRENGRVAPTVRQRPDDGGRAPTVTVPTTALSRTLDDELPAGATARDRTVRAVSAEDRAVAVRFDDGVREWFDLVVDAGVGSLRSERRGTGAGGPVTATQYEAVVDRPAGGRVRDVWVPDGLVQWLPASADGDTLVRITTAVPPAGERAIRVVRDRPEVPDVPGFEAFGRESVRHGRLPDATAPHCWWGSGRIARCGRAACPTAPAAGVGHSLGLTDALGLVSALARDGSAVPGAVDAYAAGRARRFDGVRRAAAGSAPASQVPESASEPMRSLGALRAAALEPFVGAAPAALRRGAPG